MANSTSPKTTLIFAYGTLKRNFPNHNLMIDLISSKDATFIRVCKTSTNYPLIIGPYGIPYLLNIPGKGFRVVGELYSVTERGLEKLDELEGLAIGHYERLKIEVCGEDQENEGVVEAEGYFGHRSFGEEMWRRKEALAVEEYTVEMGEGYVRKGERKDVNGCILEDIKAFIEDSKPVEE